MGAAERRQGSRGPWRGAWRRAWPAVTAGLAVAGVVVVATTGAATAHPLGWGWPTSKPTTTQMRPVTRTPVKTTAKPTVTPTATPTPTPTPSPTSCALGSVQHAGTTWCLATVDQVATDALPAGTPVALQNAPVEWADAQYVYVTGGPTSPCPPDRICGAFVNAAAIDTSHLASRSIGATVNAWGTTRSGGILLAAGIEAGS